MTDREKLLGFLEGLGVSFIPIKDLWQELYDDWQDWLGRGVRAAPFTSHLGIIPESATIVGRQATHWTSILHEAGHLLASPTVLGKGEDESSWFGWEIAVVQHLGLSEKDFLHWNRDYGISWDGPDGWREDVLNLTDADIKVFFAEKLEEARELGIVDEHGVPTHHPERNLRVAWQMKF